MNPIPHTVLLLATRVIPKMVEITIFMIQAAIVLQIIFSTLQKYAIMTNSGEFGA